VRFRDIDALNHVNNSVYLTYLEECRIAFMRSTHIGGLEQPEQGTILAHCEIDYRYPAVLGDELEVQMHVGEIRSSSFEYVYSIIRLCDQKLIAQAVTVQVCYNYVIGAPVRIPQNWREQLHAEQAT
jgi:acyl-CoA thioester hydrolase